MKKYKNQILVSAAATLLAMFVVHVWASTPVVQISNATQQCVNVLSPDSSHTCENLPKKYETSWVQ